MEEAETQLNDVKDNIVEQVALTDSPGPSSNLEAPIYAADTSNQSVSFLLQRRKRGRPRKTLPLENYSFKNGMVPSALKAPRQKPESHNSLDISLARNALNFNNGSDMPQKDFDSAKWEIVGVKRGSFPGQGPIAHLHNRISRTDDYVSTNVLYDECPQKLLDFYEKYLNLRP